MALTLNPYRAPTAEIAPLTPDVAEFDGAGFARRMVVQAVAGLATYLALCVPLHPLSALFWEGIPWFTAPGLVMLSTLLSGVLLDRPLRQAHPVWLVALVQVALNGSLFGGLAFLIQFMGQGMPEGWPLTWLLAMVIGAMWGAVGCALSLHLTFPVAWAAAHAARAWNASAGRSLSVAPE